MMSRLTKILLLGILSLSVMGGGWYLLREDDAVDAPTYSKARIETRDITDEVSATGTLNPINIVQVGSQVSGTIQHLYADFNDQVKKGQTIAQIDPAVFEAKLAEAQANLKSAEAQRDKAQVSVEEARREYNRQVDLFQKKLTAESVLDEKRFAYQAATVEHQVKMASVAQAKAALDREQVNLDYTTIFAPIDGVVISRDVDVGQTVAASLQAPTLFSIAKDLTQMQVEADVDEAFIGQVKEDQPVSFTVFAYPTRRFEGKVAQVRLQPKVDAGVVKYNCIIHVDNNDLALKPGMTATVSIEVAQREQVLSVPNAALRFVPDWPQEDLDQLRKQLEPGQAILWRVVDEALEPLVVTTGIISDKVTEISGPDIENNMSIAVPLKRQDAKRQRRFGLSLF